jgi:hypothetical protein
LNIHQYLLAIKNGTAINAKRMMKLLDEKGVSFQDLGTPVFYKKDRYHLENINTVLLDDLLTQFAPPTSREDASRRNGDSHLFRTKTAYFVAKKINSQDDLFVVNCSSNTDIMKQWPDAAMTTIVLIENSDCFTYSKSFLKTLKLENLGSNVVVIWSSGKSITHPEAIRLLGHFKTIRYCPDYDLAGIEIYETLHKKLGEKIVFVMPDNLSEFAKYCRKPEERKKFTQALSKAKKWGFTPMVQLLTKGLGVLEQEVLIGEEYE